MKWLQGLFSGESVINRIPREGGTIDELLAAYNAGTGKALPGTIEFRSVGFSGQPVANPIFSLDDFVQEVVSPNSLHYSVLQQNPIALLRLAASPDELESLKWAIQARRTRFISNFYAMPTYPILQLVLAIFDQPTDPFKIESVRDITLGAERGFISSLLSKGDFDLRVYDETGEEFFFQTQIALKESDRRQLHDNVNKAARLWLHIPDRQRNFDNAHERFTQLHTVQELKILPD